MTPSSSDILTCLLALLIMLAIGIASVLSVLWVWL